MLRLALGRLVLTLPTMLAAATLVFLMLHLVPGDPVDVMLGESTQAADRAALRRTLGLDRPLATQYGAFLLGLVRGDLGRSLVQGTAVAELVAARFPATAELTIAALAVALALAFPLGLAAAARPGTWLDRGSIGLALLGVSVPSFWLGPMLILLLSIHWRWLPVSGRGTWAHLVLPACTLGFGMAAILTRMTRASVLECLGEDYVRTARAKGVGRLAILTRHALRNALGPVVTILGLQFGALLAGTVITETIFAWPGIGRLLIDAINQRDYPVVQGCVLVIAACFVIANALADVVNAWLDPRSGAAAARSNG
ncbi:MAG: glutathione ABC transporter permease GsiC [Polyangiaceae bacterium UTPRO1]|jgi:peptide/nickel transport system permease protein|nr:ABC transporter permease [Myxococcales bacterium]OQY65644.1 MAG: glutathione ABC transporter permease GsiC [Polyangiaceae bacterium UTPRO1]